jgi:hypothetical protein
MFRAIMFAVAGAAALSAGFAQAGGSCSTKGKTQYRTQQYAQKTHVKQHVVVKPIYIEPVQHCYYKLYYTKPCWDYQKTLKFDNLAEAKHMALELQYNGYEVVLTKIEGHGYAQQSYGEGKLGKSQMFDSQISFDY